ncbi:MAG TPA: YcxB family protein [Rhodanobacteraceae bacterium]|nr:YcxB family protein [Rhodanobacteraceae bacterium]
MTPFVVEVSYRLREYLSVVWEYAPTSIVAMGSGVSAGPPPPEPNAVALLFARLVIVVGSVPMFFYKVSRVGRCQFEFTESAVTRTCKLGELQTPWAEVRHVYALSRAFLIVKAQGGLPVPYRCLSSAQHDGLDAFFTSLNAGLHKAQHQV